MADDRREQLGSGDLITLVSDVGPVPMNVGAILFVVGDVDAATSSSHSRDPRRTDVQLPLP
ncbi:hypothetical protein [Rhodococcus opacus]|uniref:Uncharacterized protein n=1 Tax=Rhodococcus opacus TaxID=37919 RepID=A0A076EF97_RHOOP|nr:hypothetical protein [Rhodococcus opacus]AII03832.1 hypothetical protein EP51_04090 [Rhodococcus opacus]